MPRSPSCCPESRRSVPEGRNATQLGRGYSGPWSRSSIRRLLFAFHSPQTAARPPVQVLRGPFPAEPRRGRVRHPTRNWNLRPLSFCFQESEVSVPPDDRGIFFFFISVETYGSFARFQGSRCSEVSWRCSSVHFRPLLRARGGSFPLVNVRPPFWEKFSNRSVDKFPPRRQPPSGRLRLAVSASDPRAHPLPLSLTVSLFVLLLWFPHYFPSALFSGLSMQFVICALAILIPKGSFCCRPLRFCCCCFFK